MDNPTDNKTLVKQAQSILNELGYDISTGHIYELMSRLGGHNSHNVAKAAGADFRVVVDKVKSQQDIVVKAGSHKDMFTVKVKVYLDEAEMVKFYQVSAENEKHAEKIVSEYLKFRYSGDWSKEAPEESRLISLVESDEDYLLKNWEMVSPFQERAKVEWVSALPKKAHFNPSSSPAKEKDRSYLDVELSYQLYKPEERKRDPGYYQMKILRGEGVYITEEITGEAVRKLHSIISLDKKPLNLIVKLDNWTKLSEEASLDNLNHQDVFWSTSLTDLGMMGSRIEARWGEFKKVLKHRYYVPNGQIVYLNEVFEQEK